MLKLLAGPLIGALIGYCTNYIAVKMLFRPRTEKRIFGRRVPFTPGAIPKGKARLAQAAGAVVAGTLITGDDISERLLSDEIENYLTNRVIDTFDLEIRETGEAMLTEEGYANLEDKITDQLTEKGLREIDKADIAGGIRTRGKEMIMARIQNSMLAMFLGEQAIDGILEGLIPEVERFIQENGEGIIRPIVRENVHEVGASSILKIAEKSGYHEDDVRRVVHEIYLRVATSGVEKVLRHINIAGVIEDKINDMSVEELERLVLEVTKNELNMIVRLGAVIGFLLGCLNLFI
ncbi:MAG: DUF445 family protein [Firmicutes bacterium]|nr:DUF445 family protein [Bacillota bacterium]